jgi:hypothetical protein
MITKDIIYIIALLVITVILFLNQRRQAEKSAEKIVEKYKKENDDLKTLLDTMSKKYKAKTMEWYELFDKQHKTFETMTLAYANQLKTFRKLYEELTDGWNDAFRTLLDKHTKVMEQAKSLIEYLTEKKIIVSDSINTETKH